MAIRVLKSFRPVNVSFGWKAFLAGVLTCFFWGGAVRAFLSSSSLETYIMNSWEQQVQGWTLELREPQLVLSRGLLPAFGVQLGMVRALPEDSCKNSYGAQLVDTFVPLAFIDSIINKKIVFGRIHIAQVSLINEGQRCLEPAAFANTSSSDQVDTTKQEPASRLKLLSKKIDFSGIERAYKKIGMLLDNIDRKGAYSVQAREFWWQQENKILVVHNLLLKAQAAEIEVKGQLDFGRWDSVLGEFQKIPFEANLKKEQGLNISVEAPYKEGSLKTQVKYDPKLKKPVQFSLDLKYFPLAKLLQMSKVSAADVELSHVWVNCKAQLDSAQSAELLELQLPTCEVLGTEGELVAKNLKLAWSQKNGLALADPLVLELNGWPIKSLLEIIRREGPSGVFQDFGELSGILEVRSAKDIELNWKIEEAKFYFSRNGKRGAQTVEYAKGSLSFLEDRYSGILTEMNLEQGEFVGTMSYNFNKKFSEGVIQVAIEHLKFHPSIQKLLINGVLGSLAIFGGMDVSEGKVKSWRGNIGLGNLFSSQWKSEKVKMDTRYINNKFVANMELDKVLFESNHPFYGWMGKSLKKLNPLSLEYTKDPIPVFNWKASLIIEPGEITLKSPYTKIGSRDQLFMIDGHYSKQQLNGKIGFKASKGRVEILKLLGDDKLWTLKGSAESHPLFNFEESEKKSSLPPFNEISKKVIESANKIMPKAKAETSPNSESLEP